MTIGIAVNKHGSTAIAFDSLTSLQGREKHDRSNQSTNKCLSNRSQRIIGAGRMVYLDYLELFLSQHHWPKPDATRLEVLIFFHRFWRFMVGDMGVMEAKSSEDPYTVDIDIQIILVAPNKIYEIDETLKVREYKKYCAIGSGAEYAYGALKLLYEQDMSAREIAYSACGVACEYDLNSDEPINAEEVNK